jgi:hypothetical protein
MDGQGRFRPEQSEDGDFVLMPFVSNGQTVLAFDLLSKKSPPASFGGSEQAGIK